MATTTYFGLQKLGPQDTLASYDYAFGNANMDTIDRLLNKVHDAVFLEEGIIADPTEPLSLVVDTEGGNIRAGVTVRYKFTWVDVTGAETAASPEAVVATPAPVASPAAPSLVQASTGGTLLAGSYFYRLSAYASVNTLETIGGTVVFDTIASGSTNKITLTLPSLPAGADGFNVYRRGPGDSNYFYVDSIDMNVATPPSTYVDTGSLSPNCNRSPATQNLTNSTNMITITVPGATPTVPDGYTWKLYRTYISGNYNSSLLQWVITETSTGSGIIFPYAEDTGQTTSVGSPPSVSTITGDGNRVDLLETAVTALDVRVVDLEAATPGSITWGTAVPDGLGLLEDSPGWYWSDAATPQSGPWMDYEVAETTVTTNLSVGPHDASSIGTKILEFVEVDGQTATDLNEAQIFGQALHLDTQYVSSWNLDAYRSSPGDAGAGLDLRDYDGTERLVSLFAGPTEAYVQVAGLPTQVYPLLKLESSATPSVYEVYENGRVVDRIPFNTHTANYTLVLTDVGTLVDMNNASSRTITVPTNVTAAFPIGTRIYLSQSGAGVLTVAGDVGVTVQTPHTLSFEQYEARLLIKVATNTWILEGGTPSWVQDLNDQTGTTYTFALSDHSLIVTLANASAITATVPTNATAAIPIGARIDIVQKGAGQVTVAGALGVTVNKTSTDTLKLRTQWSVATLIKLGTNEWLLVGDLEAL